MIPGTVTTRGGASPAGCLYEPGVMGGRGGEKHDTQLTLRIEQLSRSLHHQPPRPAGSVCASTGSVPPRKSSGGAGGLTRLVTSSREQRPSKRHTQGLQTRSHAADVFPSSNYYYYLKRRAEPSRAEPCAAVKRATPLVSAAALRQSGLMWPKCGFPSGSLLPTYGHSIPTLLHGSTRVKFFPFCRP